MLLHQVDVCQIPLNARAVAPILGAVACVLVLASIAGQVVKYGSGHNNVKGLVPLFDVDQERNIPTFFSALLMLFAALLLAIIGVCGGRQRAPHVSKWAILSLGFTLMAYDETMEVHEKLVKPIQAMLGGGHLGILYFAWVIPAIACVFFLVLFFARFLLHLPAATRRRFIIAAVLYLGGAVGVEMIGGYYYELHGPDSFAYSMIVTVEESLEMAGLIVFIVALLTHCAENHKEVRLRFVT